MLEEVQRSAEAVTVDGMAALLGLHPNTVRKHLDGLVDQSLLKVTVAPPHGRGRPARQYVSAERTEPDPRVRDYAALAGALAGHIARTSNHPRGDALEAGDSWGRALSRGLAPGGPELARRKVVALLDDLGFDPETDAAATTARLRRCPLLDVARTYPDVVCAVHLGLVRGALNALGGDPVGADLVPFAEPGACRLRLGTVEAEPIAP